MITVLVADDHDLVRFGIVCMLAELPKIDVVGQAASGEEAVQLAKQLKPQVVLMDLHMPGIGGLLATRKLKAFDPNIKVIALTAQVEDPFPAKLLKAGASGFVTKNASIEQMVEAIRKVAAGQRYICPEVAQAMALKPFGNEADASPFGQLTERELQISMMIAESIKAPTIAKQLSISPKTVHSLRYRIFDKLDISGDVELTLLAVRHNLISGRVSQ